METALAIQLTIATLLQILLFVLFGRYLAPRWVAVSRMVFYYLITWVLATSLGWWSLIWIVGHPALSIVGHAIWCGKNGIDWRTCEPREKYLRLQPLCAGGLGEPERMR